jgi:methylenetetrahydrofolate dehydrogenase (NADP+)/methenyltetrahydrofolate cyclohydrolase
VPARILDGKQLAKSVRSEVAAKVAELSARLGRPPGLDVVLIGEDPASQVYVRNKQTQCNDAGMRGRVHPLSAGVTQAELLDLLDRLNADPSVDGILVQFPLPRQIDEQAVVERISPLKDVDGFHPENAGLLAIGRPRFVPCTPLGIQRMLNAAGIPTKGARAVVLGRSNIVGKPMALLLMGRGPGGDATVTVCHTSTRDAESIAREADILIVAMGKPEHVDAKWIKPGAVVVDVGIHRRSDGKLCGDTKQDEVVQVAWWITPVPGGVGPMTVAMLLENTLRAATLHVQ